MNQLLFNDYMITQAFQDMFSTCFRSKSKYFDLKKEVTEKKNITVSVPFFYRPSLSNTKKTSHISLSLSSLPLLFSLRREWQLMGRLSLRQRNEAFSSVISLNFSEQSQEFCLVKSLTISIRPVNTNESSAPNPKITKNRFSTSLMIQTRSVSR